MTCIHDQAERQEWTTERLNAALTAMRRQGRPFEPIILSAQDEATLDALEANW